VLPALRLEPYSAFLAAYRLSRLSCADALERSTTLDPDDPLTIPPGLSEHPTIPPYLHPELPAGERRARRLALLLDSDDPEIRDWAQAEYLKLGRDERRLVREGVFEVKVALDGADERIPEDWSANEREEDLEKLKERLERAKERREDREEDEREMVWAREMFGKWFIDGRVDGVFRLAAEILDAFLKEVARDEGEEWVREEAMEEAAAAEGQSPALSKVVPKSRGPSSTLGSKTLGAEQVPPMGAASSASVASSKRKGKQRSEPASKVGDEPEPESKLELEPEPASAPAADPEAKVEDPEPALVESPRALSHADPSPERSPSPIPVPLPVLHPSIFSEEGLLNYAINSIHPEPPPEPSAPVEQEQVRAESQVSSDNHTITPQGHSSDPAVQHNTYGDFYAKDPRRRRTPLLHVKPLPNNQPLPKPEREYDSYADFYENDSRLRKHVDDRPLPALVKKEAAKTADRSSRPQSSSKPPKLTIPSKAPADPPRVSESKHRRRSHSRHRNRHKVPSSFENFAISSQISGSSGRLTTPAASDARSHSRSRSRESENRHRSHRKSAHRSRRPSPGLTSPTPSHGSRRHRDSHSRRETPPLPVPAPKPKPKPVLAPKRSWVPFRIKGGALSNGSPSRTSSPEPIPVMPHGTAYNVPGALTSTMASDQGEREDGGNGNDDHAQEDAVVPPAPPLPPVQFWLPGFPAYKMNLGRPGRNVSASTEDDRRRRRHRDRHHHSLSTSTSVSSASASSTSRVLQPPPPPVFLALGARRACVPYTPAFQGIDIRMVRPLSAREKLAMRDAVSVLVRLGAKVVGAEAGGLGVRGEMWSLSYVGFQ
jgi:hypothetical protein